ncbi:restriction endonuclease subunit S [Teredinibacter turnerae]|uniref:restriction endonuclease subunit S n=1 Tax=Teredinibacter turnerae TaxID=2426 RepID=UPI00035E491E|nr:restriction endonuclease subunit S [Teredinibacter turnerae]
MSWAAKTLGELCDQSDGIVQTGPFGSQLKQSEYIDDVAGVPVVMPKDIKEGAIDEGEIARISESKANALSRHMLAAGDIVFPRRGEISKRGYIKEGGKYFCGTGCLKIHMPDNEVLNKYLFYYLDQDHVVKWLEGRAIGSTMLNLNTSIMRSVNINFPDLNSQKRIVSALSAYDDLIENNKRRIELLEESARQLYKEWFVRFRFPGHEHVKIIDGVPEGWEAGVVSDFYKTSSGGTPSRKVPEYYTGDINWVKTQELENSFIFETSEKITDTAIKKSSARLFPENTVLVAMYGATIGQLGILAKESTSNQACCALISNSELSHYIHAFLFLLENKSGLIGRSKGAAQNNISQDIVKNFEMVMPSQQLMTQFIDYVDPVFTQIKTLSLEIEKLTQARDILLPKLMSGEVVV